LGGVGGQDGIRVHFLGLVRIFMFLNNFLRKLIKLLESVERCLVAIHTERLGKHHVKSVFLVSLY
jgi:hypothetical protein